MLSRIVPFALALLLLSACEARRSPYTGSDTSHSASQLSGGRKSVDELIGAGLNALSRRDTATLRSLAVTREEFERVILPTMGEKYPAARDTSSQAREFLADNHFRSSDKALRRALNDVGGAGAFELDGVEFKETAKLSAYTLHEGTQVKARAADGSEKNLTVFGSVVEQGGVFKLLGFRDRD